MEDVETQRTLVKSVPELWAELSENAMLGRLLNEPFGEIRITRLTPESSIEWESELAAGSVELAPSGFGTRVRLTAQINEPEPPPAAGVAPPGWRALLSRLLRRPQSPTEAPAAAAEPTSPPLDAAVAETALRGVLDEIGMPRHRPFSRHPGPPAR